MDDIGIFGSVQTMEHDAPGIYMAERFTIDFVFQPVPKPLVLCQRRPPHARRGHHASAKFTHDFFPQLRVITDSSEI